MLAVWRRASMNMGFSVAISNDDEMSWYKPLVGYATGPQKTPAGGSMSIAPHDCQENSNHLRRLERGSFLGH